MQEVINVILVEKYFGVKGYVNKNMDGSYTIFIDASLSRDEQIEVYEHEISHIRNGDFEKYNVNEIEYFAHKYAF